MCFNNYYVLLGFFCGTTPLINGEGLSDSPRCCSSGAETFEAYRTSPKELEQGCQGLGRKTVHGLFYPVVDTNMAGLK